MSRHDPAMRLTLLVLPAHDIQWYRGTLEPREIQWAHTAGSPDPWHDIFGQNGRFHHYEPS
jgi:hypothetical protein